MDERRYLVIGGGITGLAAAVSLSPEPKMFPIRPQDDNERPSARMIRTRIANPPADAPMSLSFLGFWA